MFELIFLVRVDYSIENGIVYFGIYWEYVEM